LAYVWANIRCLLETMSELPGEKDETHELNAVLVE
jgi:hypothetical protein